MEVMKLQMVVDKEEAQNKTLNFKKNSFAINMGIISNKYQPNQNCTGDIGDISFHSSIAENNTAVSQFSPQVHNQENISG